MKKMAFVDLTNFYDWPMGGMLEYELSILKHLVKEYDVDIWGMAVDGKVNSSIDIDGKKYPIHIFGNVKNKRKLIPNYWRGLCIFNQKEFFDSNYDVVYAHTGSCLIAARSLKKAGTKLVYHQHGLNHRSDYSLMSLIQRPALKLAQKYADLVFVVSDTESVNLYSQEMKDKTDAKYVSIGSPVDLSCFDRKVIQKELDFKKNLPTKTYIYTGRLSAFKNVKTLIDAVYMYKNKVNENVTLVVAGSGDEWDAINKQIIELNLQNNVKMLGSVSHNEIYSLLEKADVFLTASGGEGVSVSVIEDYAAGLPVVCFNVPGLEKQVLNNVTGVIAEEKNAESFFKAMLEVDRKRFELSLNCLVEAQKYEAGKISKKIISEINSLF